MCVCRKRACPAHFTCTIRCQIRSAVGHLAFAHRARALGPAYAALHRCEIDPVHLLKAARVACLACLHAGGRRRHGAHMELSSSTALAEQLPRRGLVQSSGTSHAHPSAHGPIHFIIEKRSCGAICTVGHVDIICETARCTLGASTDIVRYVLIRARLTLRRRSWRRSWRRAGCGRWCGRWCGSRHALRLAAHTRGPLVGAASSTIYGAREWRKGVHCARVASAISRTVRGWPRDLVRTWCAQCHIAASVCRVVGAELPDGARFTSRESSVPGVILAVVQFVAILPCGTCLAQPFVTGSAIAIEAQLAALVA